MPEATLTNHQEALTAPKITPAKLLLSAAKLLASATKLLASATKLLASAAKLLASAAKLLASTAKLLASATESQLTFFKEPTDDFKGQPTTLKQQRTP